MVGKIDFDLLDPNAALKGAANTNSLLTQFARQKAGQLMASGDRKGAVNTLYQDGSLDDANKLQVNINENDQNVQKLSTAERARQTEMVVDAANVLQQVRKKGGDGAIAGAYAQMRPLFLHHGATEQDLAPFDQAMQQNPGAFVDHLEAYAQAHQKATTLSPGQTSFVNGRPIAHAPANLQLRNTTAGGRLTEANVDDNPMVGSDPDNPVQVETDDDYNALPSGTHFQTPDGNVRVKP